MSFMMNAKLPFSCQRAYDGTGFCFVRYESCSASGAKRVIRAGVLFSV